MPLFLGCGGPVLGTGPNPAHIKAPAVARVGPPACGRLSCPAAARSFQTA